MGRSWPQTGWLRETSLPSLAYLCVCSDRTVKDNLDALKTEQSDLDFEVSTEPASVRAFLDAHFAGEKIIFSTYQSASVVGEALRTRAPITSAATSGFQLFHVNGTMPTTRREHARNIWPGLDPFFISFICLFCVCQRI